MDNKTAASGGGNKWKPSDVLKPMVEGENKIR